MWFALCFECVWLLLVCWWRASKRRRGGAIYSLARYKRSDSQETASTALLGTSPHPDEATRSISASDGKSTLTRFLGRWMRGSLNSKRIEDVELKELDAITPADVAPLESQDEALMDDLNECPVRTRAPRQSRARLFLGSCAYVAATHAGINDGPYRRDLEA